MTTKTNTIDSKKALQDGANVKNILEGGVCTSVMHTQLTQATGTKGDKDHPLSSLHLVTHEVQRQSQELNDGDMSSLVKRLNAQMNLLDVAFAKIMTFAIDQKSVDAIAKLTNTAMRVQSNARMTAQTICDLKHPRQQVNFVRAENANVATNQQINHAQAEKSSAKRTIQR